MGQWPTFRSLSAVWPAMASLPVLLLFSSIGLAGAVDTHRPRSFLQGPVARPARLPAVDAARDDSGTGPADEALTPQPAGNDSSGRSPQVAPFRTRAAEDAPRREDAAPAALPSGSALPVVIADLEGETTPLERDLFADAKNARLRRHSLLSAALIAGGVEDAPALRYYEGRMHDLVAQLHEEKLPGAPIERAATIFRFLHRRVLFGGYDLSFTDLRRVLDEGRFNCVSATVLFNHLAASCGLEAVALETTGHAMSRLKLPDGPLDVETTCPQWFRLRSDADGQRQAISKLLGRDDASEPARLREVSAAQVAAMIYYNRGVEALAEQRFAEAAAANVKALRLDPESRVVAGNLLATLNNWAIALSAAKQHAAAAELLARGTAMDPTYSPYVVNVVHVYHAWAAELCAAGRFEAASGRVAEGARRFPQSTQLREVQREVFRHWARAAYDRDGLEAAVSIFDRARRALPDDEEMSRLEAAELNEWALAKLTRGAFPAALATFDLAIARQPFSELLCENRRRALARWAEALLGRLALATSSGAT